MTLDLTAALQALAGLLAAVLSAFLLPFLKSELTARQRAALAGWVSVAVSAAEQIGELTTGADKKAYVVAFLRSKGYTVDLGRIGDEINALIEAAVYALKN